MVSAFDLHVVPVFARLVAAGAVYFFVLALSNILWLRASSRRPRRACAAKVSVMIPARDEEKNIAHCLDSLIRQTHGNLEILVLDDQSSDRTWEIISRYESEHPRLVRALRGRPLPDQGWNGKPHALHQLAEQASGEYLLFTDADTVHAPDSVAWAAANLEWHRVDLVSGYARQTLGTFGEALTVPIMYLMTAIVMPIWLIAATRAPFFTFAIGQFVMMRRKAYDQAGGYAAISHEINDDIAIARAVRRAGFRTIFLDARRYVSCRMYDGFRGAFEGLTRCIAEFINRRLVSLVSATVATVLLFLLPCILAIPLAAIGHAEGGLVAASVLLFLLTWCAVLYDRGLRWYVPLLYPAMFVLGLVMMWRGYRNLAGGKGVVWKGRVVK